MRVGAHLWLRGAAYFRILMFQSLKRREPMMVNESPSQIGVRKAWQAPALEKLPKLTELTLQSGSSIDGWGSTSSGGSTVF